MSIRNLLYSASIAAAITLHPVYSRLEAIASHEHTREFYDSFKSVEELQTEVLEHETAMGYAFLSGWYSNKKDLENHGKYVKKALELDSKVSMANHNMAGYLLRSEGKNVDLEQVQGYANRALQYASHPRDKVRAYGLLAILCSKRRDYTKCKEFVELGLKVDPHDKALLSFKSQLP